MERACWMSCFAWAVTCILPASCNSTTPRSTVTALLDSYNPYEHPGHNTGEPVVINVSGHLNNVYSVDLADMDITVELILRLEWRDPRLEDPRLGNSTIPISRDLFDSVWIPDIYFPNEKDSDLHEITVPNQALWLQPEGHVYYSQRLTLTVACEFDLRNYPMDEQSCHIPMSSYTLGHTDLRLVWRDSLPHITHYDISMPEYSLVDVHTTESQMQRDLWQFDYLTVTIELEREFQYHVLQTYLPSSLVVVLSWVSFWIDHDAVPARVTLSLVTVLTITTQSAGVNRMLPNVSYIKAIDVWVAACLIAIFGSLVEYAAVNSLARTTKKQQKTAESYQVTPAVEVLRNEPEGQAKPAQGADVVSINSSRNDRRVADGRPEHIDYASRFLFPAAFTLFNLVYWVLYLHIV